MPGRGEHDQGNERFARPEDENGEKDPGGDIGLGFFGMDVAMACEMGVGMVVVLPDLVVMTMGMRPAFQGPAYPPEEAENDRAQDMTEPAEEGNEEGFRERPAPRPGHDDEREVMIGSDEGMDESYGRRRPRQDPDVEVHGSFIPQSRRGRHGERHCDS